MKVFHLPITILNTRWKNTKYVRIFLFHDSLATEKRARELIVRGFRRRIRVKCQFNMNKN